jgi:TRAP-type C4-dicarboxylate transport system substrate-binding protein
MVLQEYITPLQRVALHKLVKRVQRYQEKWEKEHDRSARAFARAAMDEIVDLIAHRAQYSAAARAYLKEYREQGADWDWVDGLLTSSIG